MCLGYISTEKNKKKFLKEAGKRGYIRVYKECQSGQSGWHYAYHKPYKSGLQESNHKEQLSVDYSWHVYLSLTKVKKEKYDESSIMICYAKPSWLRGLSLRTKEATFTHLVFPDWDKGDMTIKEFRQICRG